MILRDLIRRLPKTDLHVHLDGSLRETTLVELARDAGVTLPSTTVEGLNELVFKSSYSNLGEYLRGFAYTTAVLRSPEALGRAAYELAIDNAAEGVRYVEVRFAPHLHMDDRFRFDDVLEAVDFGLGRAQSELNAQADVRAGTEVPFHYGIIVCALRWFTPEFSGWYRALAGALKDTPPKQVFGLASLELARAAIRCRDERGIPIVGFDLAGQEDGFPAHDHRKAYELATLHFLHRTVHAGEAYGPESIFEALTVLHADRIGHGYHLFAPELCGPNIKDPQGYVDELAEYIADRRITIEVCLTSNVQTNPAIGRLQDHAFKHMLAGRLSTTLCTDNRLVSHTTVTDEYVRAVEAFNLSMPQLRDIVIHGFKRSFFRGTYAEKRAYVRKVIDRVDALVE